MSISKQFHRNLPHKARISIFNGKKELETFINEDNNSNKSTESIHARKGRNLKRNKEYLLGCESIYEKFTIKKDAKSSISFTPNHSKATIISLKRIRY